MYLKFVHVEEVDPVAGCSNARRLFNVLLGIIDKEHLLGRPAVRLHELGDEPRLDEAEGCAPRVEPCDDAGPEHERYTGIGDENGWVLDGDEKCSPGEWSTSVDHEAPPPSFGEARPGIGEPSRLNCATCAPSECGLSILKPKT